MSASDHLSPVQFPTSDLYDVHSHEYDMRLGMLNTSQGSGSDLARLTPNIAERGVQEPIHLTAREVPDVGTRYSMSDGHHRAIGAIRARVPSVPVVIHHREV
jgi:ParB-like chromosome segregation protein Spo0J